MANIMNTFVAGRMDSDTDYNLIDSKNCVYALNLRPTGYGKDGAMHNIKGSVELADFSEGGTMTVIGMYAGENNKLYSFLARRDGLSKIIETDVIVGSSRVVISDTAILRFDLILNNTYGGKKKYLLNIDQIDDLLFFSSEEWEYPRCINLKDDYSSGFTADDITLAKKPPMEAPQIIAVENHKYENNDNDTFVSFAYRYKYADGDYSALSFYSDTAFDPDGDKGFAINAQKDNTAMVNKWDYVKLMVNSGGKNVTDVEVYAREHGSNTAYLIYSVNKKQAGISNDALISNIEYKFSRNYEVLSEPETLMPFSNVPKFPMTQTAVGNRMFYGNYKEGYDIENVDYAVYKKQAAFLETSKRETAISMFKYKVGVIYYNDFNESTTVLLPTDQSKAEVEINFADRLYRNMLEVSLKTPPPAFATKMKFAVQTDNLNFENLYFTYVKRVGKYVYLLPKANDLNRVSADDILFFTETNIASYREFSILEITDKTKADGFQNPGKYIKIEDAEKFISFQKNKGKDMDYEGLYDIDILPDDGDKNTVVAGVTYAFDNRPSPFSHFLSILNYHRLPHGSFQDVQLYTGDEVAFEFGIQFYRNVTKTGGNGARLLSYIPLKTETFFVDSDYDNVYDFLNEKLQETMFDFSGNAGTLKFTLTTEVDDLINTKYPDIADLDNEKGWRIGGLGILDMKLTHGINGAFARTKNKENLQPYYFETSKAYSVLNGKVFGDGVDSEGNPTFDIGFYNGYCWENGVESYKIKDNFNGKQLKNNLRVNGYDKKGYKRVHKKNDITYSGSYNYELGINELSNFNIALANWKSLPVHYGEIQRLISTDGDITVFCDDKVILQYYGKSILADLTGNENVAIAKDVLGDYQVLPYTFGTQNPESVVKSVDGIYFVDKKRTRYLFLADRQMAELNPEGSGHHRTGVMEIKAHQNFLSSYNEAHGEVNFGLDHDGIVVFNPQAKGFSHYYDFGFDYLKAMNGRHFTGYNGSVYEDEATESYNVFAGGQHRKSKLKFVVNPEAASDKIYQAIFLQSNTPWDTEVKSNLTASKFSENAYTQKESFFYSEIFRDNATKKGIVGVGTIQNISGKTIQFKNNISNQVAVGDSLSREDLQYSTLIEKIEGNTITVADASIFDKGMFAVAQKKISAGFRPGGVPIRGEWMEVSLTKAGSSPYQLTTVNTEVIKSFR